MIQVILRGDTAPVVANWEQAVVQPWNLSGTVIATLKLTGPAGEAHYLIGEVVGWRFVTVEKDEPKPKPELKVGMKRP